MATTESRPGFRLPWAGEHRTDATDEAQTADPDAVTEDAEATASASETTPGADAAAATTQPEPTTQAAAPAPSAPAPSTTPDPGARPSVRKPTKFLADLTKAMQAAAGAEREETLELFQLEAKSFVESIHGRASTEAESLKKQADEDVAAIREWSKQEIARIREETDQKISARKSTLEDEVEEHAARIEREIERVHATVAAFEQEMASFFETLLAETDPTRFAALAANMPEPPSFESPSARTARSEAPTPQPVASDQDAAEPVAPEPSAEAAIEPVEDREAAFAAIEAAARAADEAEAEAGEVAEATDPESEEAPAEGEAELDPRLSALGMGAGFDAAEAEALADLPTADQAAEEDEVAEIGEEAVAARLAGLVGSGASSPAVAEPETGHQTTVTIVGLVSVASIASFKRTLARIPGVETVGVSSGPDGEFVFAVRHDPSLELAEVVPTLAGFGARVTESGDGFVKATAHDPEAGA
jgi:hypothetical protein